MATPRFDAIKAKVRDWSARYQTALVPDSIIEDCLQYGCDDIYRTLRIPQLEITLRFTCAAEHNLNEKYTEFTVPEDLIEFIYLARKDQNKEQLVTMYNQVNDVRTFLDPQAEQYNKYRYVWKDMSFLIHPKLEIGEQVELHYYRRLGKLDAMYSVVPENYDGNYADAAQPLLDLAVAPAGETLWQAGTSPNKAAFLTYAEAVDWAAIYGGTPTAVNYTGKEAWNWLRDANEKIVIYAALKHVGLYLRDEVMEKKYEEETNKIIELNNREDKYRRAKGGNVQVNVNTGGMI
jgi:hypothetical protein